MLVDELQQRLRLARIHAGRRLVEHQEARARRERAHQLQPPLVAIGELARPRVGAARQADEVEQLRRRSRRPRPPPAAASACPRSASSMPVGWRSCAAARMFSAHREAAEEARALEGAGDAEPHDRRQRTGARWAGRRREPTPRSARRKPLTRLKKVLLPEPFGPDHADDLAARTSIPWSRSATRLRKALVRPLV